ncbi:MAG: hypothetical protein AAGA18_00820 [Verrucomicrobiota bacterium]
MNRRKLTALVVIVFLFLYSILKFYYEKVITGEHQLLRHGATAEIKYSMRDALGQGLLLTALSGFRGVAANLIWLEVTEAWMERNWIKLKKNVEIAVLLQPRNEFYWEQGAWHLAFNASLNSSTDLGNIHTNFREKQEESLQWINQGINLLERGIAFNPDSSQLHERLADLYYRRLKDYHRAAKYYEMASQLPGAKQYVLRLPGYMYEKAGDEQAEHEYWEKVLSRISENELASPQWQRPRQRILELEEKMD